MVRSVAAQFEELLRLRRESPSKVWGEAMEMGIAGLYRETILRQYLNKQLSRTQAIQRVGRDLVDLTDQQRRVVQKDIAWGLGTR